MNITWNNGSIYVYGIAFRVGVGQTSNYNLLINTINSWTYFDNCSLQLVTTFNGGIYIQFGSTNNATVFVLNNTTMFFG